MQVRKRQATSKFFELNLTLPWRSHIGIMYYVFFSFTVSQIVKGFATLNHLVEQESILTTVISSL